MAERPRPHGDGAAGPPFAPVCIVMTGTGHLQGLVAPRRQLARLTAAFVAVAALAAAAACDRAAPLLVAEQDTSRARGTISGTVRVPESPGLIEGRVVEVVNVATEERQRTTTNTNGGFLLKVKPGTYRVELTLRDSEALVKHPGVVKVNRSHVDAHADFVVGRTRTTRPRGAGSRTDAGLGSPIA